jgi:hypothetical protein
MEDTHQPAPVARSMLQIRVRREHDKLATIRAISGISDQMNYDSAHALNRPHLSTASSGRLTSRKSLLLPLPGASRYCGALWH